MSTIRVNAIQNTNTTDGGISIDGSGHVSIEGQSLPSTGPLSNRNLIINGAMQVSQRGTSETGVTGNGYKQAPDRFRATLASLGTWTVSQSTEAPDGFAYSYKWDCTTADSSPTANGNVTLRQSIEAQNLQHLKKGTTDAEAVTLSFWARSNKTGTYIVQIDAPDSTRSISKSYTIDTADTWEYKTITYQGDTTGTINNDTGSGFHIYFWLAAGSTFTSGTLATEWEATTNANRAVGQVNLADSTSNEWYITGVQLEVGNVATPFEQRSYGQELARCQRYYVQDLAGTGHNAQTTASNAWFTLNVGFPVEMRTNPSIVATSPNNGTANRIELWGGTDLAYNSFSRTKNNIYWVNTSSSYTTAKAVQAKFTADAEL